jgi:hypothetical protein
LIQVHHFSSSLSNVARLLSASFNSFPRLNYNTQP